MLRKDPKKLGRVTELLNLDKELKKKRKAFDVEDDQLGKENVREEKAVEKAERKSKKARSEK